jgi:hypothetical protein
MRPGPVVALLSRSAAILTAGHARVIGAER